MFTRISHDHDVHRSGIFFVNKLKYRLHVFSRNRHIRRIRERGIDGPKQAFFRYLIEEGIGAIVIFLRNRIVFVIVAARTLEGQRKERFRKSIRPVVHIFHAVFFVDHPACLRNLVIAVEAGSE